MVLQEAQSQDLVETLSDELIAEWLAYEADENDVSVNTVEAYRVGLSVFVGWCRDNGLSMVTVVPSDVAQFKAHSKRLYAAQTVNLRLTAVRRFYSWAVITGKTLINPAADVKGVKRPKSKTHKRDALTGGEVLSVLATCDTHDLVGLRDKVVLVLMAFCGARSVELHRADVGDVRTSGDRLVLYVAGKGHTDADEFLVVPMRHEPLVREWLSVRARLHFAGVSSSDPLFVSFSNRSHGARLSLRAIRHMVKERFVLAGVVGRAKTTHSLRHSAITNAIRGGATPMQVQSMARHQSYDTTLGYFHEVSRIDSPAEDLIDYERG